ncbi:MAG TPA: HD domain-containing protein [Phycisphaerae bacterium]|nr:HD domain-containing protein [Phycisphaerae bacterium]
MAILDSTLLNLPVGLERGAATRILCACRDPSLVSHLAACLGDRFDLRSVEYPSWTTSSDLHACSVVLVDSIDAGLAAAENAVRTLGAAAPAVTVVVLGEPGAATGISWPRNGPAVRYLPSPYESGILEQCVGDYVERHRLRTAELRLTRELDQLQQRVRELDHQLKEEELQGTSSLLRLYHVVAGMGGLTTPEEIGNLLVSTAASMLKSRRVSLLVPDARGEHLRVVAAVGIAPEAIDKLRIPIGAPIAGEVFRQGRSVFVPDRKPPANWSARVDHELLGDLPFISMALSGPDSVVAVLNICEPVTASAYSEAALTGLHAITEAAAMALVNEIRGRERNEARDGIMMALAKLPESRDPETGAHLERVQNYCRLIAETMARTSKYRAEITPEFISALVWASPLHDIGKVGVPDHILLKPGQLTPAEFEIMKRHPIIGGDTIRSLVERSGRQDFLRMAMDIAYHHHEKYDGTGYPHGLAGTAIPLSARIVALADVYDALTTARVYKEAMPHNMAAEIIRSYRGSHLDPDVVDAFVQREREFEKLARELADSE